MVWFRRNTPPTYDPSKSYRDNFGEFFHWATDLKDPFKQIPDIGERLKFGMRRHPIGFIAVYLSEQDRGIQTIGTTGIARVNIYPPGSVMKEDIHCHGFEFQSGVVRGGLRNCVYDMENSWGRGKGLPEGEGYVGYQTRVDIYGRNRVEQVTGATVFVPKPIVHELKPGDTYSLRPRKDFHSVDAAEGGAVTLFCKTPTFESPDGLSLFLRKPGEPEPPKVY